MFSTTRGQTSTWQCCCGVGGPCELAECSWLFVPWKRCGWEAMSYSYFTSCPSENTDFRQTRTRTKTTEKSCKHLLRRASDSQFFLPASEFLSCDKFHCGDKFHLANKSTCQVHMTSWFVTLPGGRGPSLKNKTHNWTPQDKNPLGGGGFFRSFMNTDLVARSNPH